MLYTLTSNSRMCSPTFFFAFLLATLCSASAPMWVDNDSRCPSAPVSGGCAPYQAGLTCLYNKICCPDRKRCTAQIQLVCREDLDFTWISGPYGHLAYSNGVCRIVSGGHMGKRRLARNDVTSVPTASTTTAPTSVLTEKSHKTKAPTAASTTAPTAASTTAPTAASTTAPTKASTTTPTAARRLEDEKSHKTKA